VDEQDYKIAKSFDVDGNGVLDPEEQAKVSLPQRRACQTNAIITFPIVFFVRDDNCFPKSFLNRTRITSGNTLQLIPAKTTPNTSREKHLFIVH
jgi:hypothetical protein